MMNTVIAYWELTKGFWLSPWFGSAPPIFTKEKGEGLNIDEMISNHGGVVGKWFSQKPKNNRKSRQ